MTQQNLPELPEPFALSVSVREDKMVECMLYQTHPTEKQKLYTAAQMHAYALASLSSQGAGDAEPLGYINAGHLHELRQGRIPYAYLYPDEGVGASEPVYARPQAAQPARVVDLAIEALEMLEPYVDRLVDYSSTSAEWPMNRAPVKVQVALSALRSAKLSTPPAAPTTSQQADGWATARAQDSSDYSREHLTDEPQAVAVTELEDVKRWFMNQETGMLVQTERGPWVRYVDVLAAFEAKKAGA